MKIRFLVVGKTEKEYLEEGIDRYVQRLLHYIPFEIKVVPELKNSKSMTEKQQKDKEGKLILQLVEEGELILLDERGKEYTSEKFADFLDKKIRQGIKQLTFVVGGPYGFSEAVYRQASALVSLSQMTFSHQMIRLFFVEQLYRAFTIMRGEPYHHK
ncbi:MAG: 23S rRNA (pseudouridine(1915)-N(3))-methyltransferase RlmH [Prevotellaceae bacterium]|jgi:23S rRNA (pseudouridine1915-N3)-methyltransferase|nr:23S rRNA (pseudouridine(1915)-N(3))-methyltransferase RlmH [Prevotellaceae bacterium]